MGLRTLYEGHYRAIEEDFLDLAVSVVQRGDALTVVTAGTEQLHRLSSLLVQRLDREVVCGVRFLPGIRHLAQILTPVPMAASGVSHADRILLSIRAMESIDPSDSMYSLRGNPAAANAMGSFFEELFDHGVTPEIYRITTMSMTRKPTDTERVIGRIFADYGSSRSRFYHRCNDMILQGTLPDEIEGYFIFYGFYDLNPAQRRFVRNFLRSALEVFWFSPMDGNSQWRGLYHRTRELLEEVDDSAVVRTGGRTGMNSFADFFESCLIQYRPVVPVQGFRITAASGETGACRVVLNRLRELQRDGNSLLSDIAVVRRKENGGNLVRMADHEGIPTSQPLTAKLDELPEGRFVLNLISLEEGDFHYSLIANLLSSGMLSDEVNPDTGEIADIAAESGILLGRLRWRDWYLSQSDGSKMGALLRELDNFFEELPEKALPSEYLGLLRDFYSDITTDDDRSTIVDLLFEGSSFRFDGEVTWKRFVESLRIHCHSADVIVRNGDAEGFRILSIEEIRGGMYKNVILMDMEEGIYPGQTIEDPRLSEDLRGRLQLTLKTQRELEDGYLLRQAGEAAGETLDIVYRHRDAAGRDIYPSSYISGVAHTEKDRSPDPSWFRVASSSPIGQMLEGEHPGQRRSVGVHRGIIPQDPFLISSAAAQRSRMDYTGFDRYDGILDPPPPIPDVYTPTMLEAYVRCPFAYLVERIWNIKKREVVIAGGSPDPMESGIVIHDTFEEIVAAHGFTASEQEIEETLSRTVYERSIGMKLGSEFLKSVFLRKQLMSISGSLKRLVTEEWAYLSHEKTLEGTLGELAIKGRVDLVLEDSSGLVLVDLKSGKLPSKKMVERGMYYQLPFYYHLAAQNFPGKNISRVSYVSVSRQSPGKQIGYSGDELKCMMDNVERNAGRIVTMMRNGLFPPVPNGRCKFCSFRSLCRNTPVQRLKEKVLSDDRMELFREMDRK